MNTELQNQGIDKATLICIHDKLQPIIEVTESIPDIDDAENIVEQVEQARAHSQRLVAITSAELVLTLIQEDILDSVDPTIGAGNIHQAAKQTDNDRVQQTVALAESVNQIKTILNMSLEDVTKPEITANLIQSNQEDLVQELNKCLYSLKRLFELAE